MIGIEAADRRLVSSELFKEDLLDLDHGAVWGSYFDKGSRQWGYACCGATRRHQPCAAAVTAKAEEPPAARHRRRRTDERSDSDSAEAVQEKPVDWGNAPQELLEASNFDSAAAFVEHIVRFTIGAWWGDQEGRQAGRGHAAHQQRSGLSPELQFLQSPDTLCQVKEALAPLLRQLESGAIDHAVLGRLREMVSLAAGREYSASNQVYMDITIGNKKWQNCLSTSQAKQQKGASIKILPSSTLTAYDSDPVAQKYIQALRRMIQFLQHLRPNEDTSKHM